MSKTETKHSLNRRDFMKTSAVAVAGTAAMTSTASAKTMKDGLDYRNHRPDRMSYKKLGRTNFMCSRLVFGCGAALMGGKAVRLLEQAYEQGVNHFDVGYDDYYKGSEKNLAAFLKAHGDDVWVTSKAPARGSMGLSKDLSYSVEQGKGDATYWLRELDKSLARLGQEHVDAYYLMGIGNEKAMESEELQNAFLQAKAAGKVDHFGISTHKRAAACLKTAISTGAYSLAMIAITPAGWYDWDTKSLLEGTANLTAIRPELDAASKAGIGLVGMKAGRFIAPGTALGKGDETAFNSVYSEKLLKADITPFQRSYAYVLENGIDVVNADMQNFKHFEENMSAARDAAKYFA